MFLLASLTVQVWITYKLTSINSRVIYVRVEHRLGYELI
jgi:hypothetical protein